MKPKAIALVLGGPKGPGRERADEDRDEPDEDDEAPESKDEGVGKPSAKEVAAYRELRDAMEAGDDETGAQALKNFIRECGGY